MMKLAGVFAAVFLAELGDKTQLATLLFAAEGDMKPLWVFVAAAAALVLSTALAVLIGTAGAKLLANIPLKLIAGLGFIAIGSWNVWEYWRG